MNRSRRRGTAVLEDPKFRKLLSHKRASTSWAKTCTGIDNKEREPPTSSLPAFEMQGLALTALNLICACPLRARLWTPDGPRQHAAKQVAVKCYISPTVLIVLRARCQRTGKYIGRQICHKPVSGAFKIDAGSWKGCEDLFPLEVCFSRNIVGDWCTSSASSRIRQGGRPFSAANVQASSAAERILAPAHFSPLPAIGRLQEEQECGNNDGVPRRVLLARTPFSGLLSSRIVASKELVLTPAFISRIGEWTILQSSSGAISQSAVAEDSSGKAWAGVLRVNHSHAALGRLGLVSMACMGAAGGWHGILPHIPMSTRILVADVPCSARTLHPRSALRSRSDDLQSASASLGTCSTLKAVCSTTSNDCRDNCSSLPKECSL